MKRFLLLFFCAQAICATQQLQCLKDSDCILRPVNCCKCSQGGKLKAVPKNTPEPDCSDRLCPQVMSKDKSCQPGKKAICKQGKCELS